MHCVWECVYHTAPLISAGIGFSYKLLLIKAFTERKFFRPDCWEQNFLQYPECSYVLHVIPKKDEQFTYMNKLVFSFVI